MFILETRYGDKGFTFWFKTLELLGSTSGHAYYFNKEDNCEYIQAYTRTNKEQAIEILDLLSSLDAIDKDLWINKHIIWSDNFIDGIRDAYRNRMVDIPAKPVSDVRNSSPIGITDVRNTQTKLNKTKLNKTILSNFEIFWKAYPKKRNKGQAENTFKKVAPDEQLMAAILTAIERAKKSAQWLKDDGQYIPYPATWLNAKGWEDEFPEKGGQGGAYRGHSKQATTEELKASIGRPLD